VKAVRLQGDKFQLKRFLHGATRLIDGACVNQRSVRLNSDGNFEIRVTSNPQSVTDTGINVFDCSSCHRGMIIFRVVLPEQSVELPEVNTVRRTDTGKSQNI